MKYSFTKGLKKTAVSLIIVALPLLAQALPSDWANVTLSGVILLLVNFLKVQYSK